MKWLWNIFNRLLLLVFMLGLLFLENCSVVFPIIAPFADLPAPTGPFTVATRTATWTDSSRDETFTDEPDFRRIVVQIWYPTQRSDQSQQNLYIDYPQLRLPAIAKQLRLPPTLFWHFDKVLTHSYTPIIDDTTHDVFPIILFSHGLSGMRFQNTALMEELASQGYVVLAADHSYAANITIFENGDIAEYRAGKHRMLRGNDLDNIDLSQISILVEDLTFMLEKLSSRTDPVLSGVPLDMSKIGVIGHSLGGAAIINALAIDSRLQAGLVLDGWYLPVPDSVIHSGLHKPFFHLGQKTWSDPRNYRRMDQLLAHSDGPIFKLLIPHTKHADFTDMPLFTPFSLYIGYTGTRDPEGLNRLLRQNTLAFFDVFLKGHDPAILQNLIQEDKAVSSYIFYPVTP